MRIFKLDEEIKMAKTLLNKMSAKSIVGNVKQVVRSIEENGGKKDLYRLWGTCTSLETGEHETNGPWVKFLGDFGAINLITGEEFGSAECFLPDTMCKMLENAMSEANAVDFVINTAIVRNDDTAVGYVYSVTPLIDAKESPRSEQLKQIALGYTSPKALSAPVAEELKTEPEQQGIVPSLSKKK